MDWFDLASIVAILIEIGLPIALAIWIWKKYRVSWAIFFLGIGLFLLSLIRIPLNSWVSLWLNQRFTMETFIVLSGLFASFTAALFEEGVRVIGLGLIIKNRTYHKGLMYGIGHGGGGEAMILVGFSSLANYVVYRFLPQLVPGIEQMYAGIAWYMPLLGALERIFAITVQIFLSILIVQAFIQKRYYYIAVAFVVHLLLDFLAVYANYKFSTLIAEAVVFVFALASIIFIIMMRPKKAEDADTRPW